MEQRPSARQRGDSICVVLAAERPVPLVDQGSVEGRLADEDEAPVESDRVALLFVEAGLVHPDRRGEHARLESNLFLRHRLLDESPMQLRHVGANGEIEVPCETQRGHPDVGVRDPSFLAELAEPGRHLERQNGRA